MALRYVNLAKLELYFPEFPSCMLPSGPQEKLTQGLESESETVAISLCSVGQNRARHCRSPRTLLSLLVPLVCVMQCLFQQLPRSCWRSSCWISFLEFWARLWRKESQLIMSTISITMIGDCERQAWVPVCLWEFLFVFFMDSSFSLFPTMYITFPSQPPALLTTRKHQMQGQQHYTRLPK